MSASGGPAGVGTGEASGTLLLRQGSRLGFVAAGCDARLEEGGKAAIWVQAFKESGGGGWVPSGERVERDVRPPRTCGNDGVSLRIADMAIVWDSGRGAAAPLILWQARTRVTDDPSLGGTEYLEDSFGLLAISVDFEADETDLTLASACSLPRGWVADQGGRHFIACGPTAAVGANARGDSEEVGVAVLQQVRPPKSFDLEWKLKIYSHGRAGRDHFRVLSVGSLCSAYPEDEDPERLRCIAVAGDRFTDHSIWNGCRVAGESPSTSSSSSWRSDLASQAIQGLAVSPLRTPQSLVLGALGRGLPTHQRSACVLLLTREGGLACLRGKETVWDLGPSFCSHNVKSLVHAELLASHEGEGSELLLVAECVGSGGEREVRSFRIKVAGGGAPEHTTKLEGRGRVVGQEVSDGDRVACLCEDESFKRVVIFIDKGKEPPSAVSEGGEDFIADAIRWRMDRQVSAVKAKGASLDRAWGMVAASQGRLESWALPLALDPAAIVLVALDAAFVPPKSFLVSGKVSNLAAGANNLVAIALVKGRGAVRGDTRRESVTTLKDDFEFEIWLDAEDFPDSEDTSRWEIEVFLCGFVRSLEEDATAGDGEDGPRRDHAPTFTQSCGFCTTPESSGRPFAHYLGSVFPSGRASGAERRIMAEGQGHPDLDLMHHACLSLEFELRQRRLGCVTDEARRGTDEAFYNCNV